MEHMALPCLFASLETDHIINNYSPKAKWRRREENNSLTIFTEPEENKCFSIIAQVIIKATAFSFLLIVSSLKISRNRAVASSAPVL